MKEYISLCQECVLWDSSLNSHSHQTVRLRDWKWTVHSGGGRFSIRQTSGDEFATLPKDYLYLYFFYFVLLHVTQWNIPAPVPRLARSNRRTETTKRDIEETKRRDEWQIETRKWHKETAKLRIGGRDDWRKQRSDTKKGRNNETTTRNDESNMLSTIWLHIYIQPWRLLQ